GPPGTGLSEGTGQAPRRSVRLVPGAGRRAPALAAARARVGVTEAGGRRIGVKRPARSSPAARGADPFEPGGRVGIARHPPVAPGREADRPDLRAVGDARALELIAEEPAVEGPQRPFDLLARVRL